VLGGGIGSNPIPAAGRSRRTVAEVVPLAAEDRDQRARGQAGGAFTGATAIALREARARAVQPRKRALSTAMPAITNRDPRPSWILVSRSRKIT